MEKWRKAQMGDFFQIKHGFAFKSKFFADEGEHIVLTPGNFEAYGGLKLKGDKEKYYSGEFPDEYLLKKDDLLVVLTDLTQDAPILGSAAFIPEDGKFLHNQRLGKVVEIDKDKIDAKFLFFLFNHKKVRDQIKATATGATVRHTAPTRIYDVVFELPPLKTQKTIAAVLSAYDDLIENNTRRIAILEEMARRLYREWFVHFRFPGHEDVEMVEVEGGNGRNGRLQIPQGWQIMPIGKVVKTLGGGTPSTKKEEFWENGDIVWYSPSDLTQADTMFMNDSSRKINELGLKNSSAKVFPAGSVMMTSRATIGVTAINTTPACTNQGFITCIPNEAVSAYQIYFWVAENMELIINFASGATFKEINKTNFRKLPILIADQVTNLRFRNIVEPLSELILNLQKKNENLRQTRDLLLPRLISGALDVSHLEIAGAPGRS